MVAGSFGSKITAKAADGNMTVYITKTGHCYHLDGCSSLRKSKIETTLQKAVDKGLTPCHNCNPGVLNAGNTGSVTVAEASIPASATVINKNAVSAAPAQAQSDDAFTKALEALKTYKGNTNEFNAYSYYINNADLQTAVGLDGDKLLDHFKKYGKAEGRIAISVDGVIEALKTYKGNTDKFNAYAYYTNNTDLQAAIGADGDKLLAHYNKYGKAEGRVAK